MGEVSMEDLRLLYANVAGIGEENSEKDIKIHKWINNNNPDIIGLAEANHNWWFRDVKPLKERSQKWCQVLGKRSCQRAIFSHNEHDPHAPQFQIGGVVLIVRGQSVNRIIDWGKDEKEMGRWAWVDLRGTRGSITRVIIAYRLVSSSNPGGSETVVSQHLRALDRLDDGRSPLAAFDDDFKGFIREGFQAGKQMILMMDVNEDVNSGKIASMLQDFNMEEKLATYLQGPSPATHHRGSRTIDGIYASKTASTSKAEYLQFKDSPGDHRSRVWDVQQCSIFGNRNSPPEKRSPRRLQSRQPSTVRRYHVHLESLFCLHRLKERTDNLRAITTFPATLEVRREYDILD